MPREMALIGESELHSYIGNGYACAQQGAPPGDPHRDLVGVGRQTHVPSKDMHEMKAAESRRERKLIQSH